MRTFVIASLALFAAIIAFREFHLNAIRSQLDKVVYGPSDELPNLIYRNSDLSEGHRQVLLGMLLPFRAPDKEASYRMDGFCTSGPFTMVVVRASWLKGKFPEPIYPIVFHTGGDHPRVVGSVTPYNDLVSFLSPIDLKDYSKLSGWWVERVMETETQPDGSADAGTNSPRR